MEENTDMQIETVATDNQEISVYTPDKHENILTTIKTYQTIYDQITGRRQRIRKDFRVNYDLEFKHLDQLNIKVTQLLKQYHVISKNCLIVVMHESDDQEIFGSYETFSKYNASNVHPIMVINIKYNFSIIYPGEKELTNYSLNISITPGNIPPSYLSERYTKLRYTGPTISIYINYSDYIIARTFIENVSDWVKAIEITEPKNKIKKYLINHFNSISMILKVILFGIIAFILFYNNDKIIPKHSFDLNRFFLVILTISCLLIMMNLIINKLITIIGLNLSIRKRYSIIDINEGDKKLKIEINKDNNKNIVKIVFSFIGTIITSGISSFILKILFGL
ncbi:hypothetical protein AGMMS50268_41040 [Spirochaetia bacterium]|nr:hypothetical protein AGMMS50268_41040 [Spirochaetia bacterium]